MTDLWPNDLATVTMRSPFTILKEQAALLGAKTSNIVKARVQRTHGRPLPAPSPAFRYDFLITAPALDNYTYRLFYLDYDVDFYPVRFVMDEAIANELGIVRGQALNAAGEQEFTDILKQIFASQKTRQVIQAILSQAIDLGPVDGNPPD